MAEQKEMRSQLEMDTDAEIEDMKRNNDKTIDAKREEYLRLKGENGITKKGIEEKTAEASTLERYTQNLTTEILNQQARTAALRDEIRQRDDTMTVSTKFTSLRNRTRSSRSTSSFWTTRSVC